MTRLAGRVDRKKTASGYSQRHRWVLSFVLIICTLRSICSALSGCGLHRVERTRRPRDRRCPFNAEVQILGGIDTAVGMERELDSVARVKIEVIPNRLRYRA
jgi:hypothetical protein